MCRDQGWACCWNPARQAGLQRVSVFGWPKPWVCKIKCRGQRKASWHEDPQGTLNPSMCSFQPPQIIADLPWALVSPFKIQWITFLSPWSSEILTVLGKISGPEILPETNHGKMFCLQSRKQLSIKIWSLLLFQWNIMWRPEGERSFLPDPGQLISCLHPFPHPEVSSPGLHGKNINVRTQGCLSASISSYHGESVWLAVRMEGGMASRLLQIFLDK